MKGNAQFPSPPKPLPMKGTQSLLGESLGPIPYIAFSAQRKCQLQLAFPRLESKCFNDVFLNLHSERFADNTIIADFRFCSR